MFNHQKIVDSLLTLFKSLLLHYLFVIASGSFDHVTVYGGYQRGRTLRLQEILAYILGYFNMFQQFLHLSFGQYACLFRDLFVAVLEQASLRYHDDFFCSGTLFNLFRLFCVLLFELIQILSIFS